MEPTFFFEVLAKTTVMEHYIGTPIGYTYVDGMKIVLVEYNKAGADDIAGIPVSVAKELRLTIKHLPKLEMSERDIGYFPKAISMPIWKDGIVQVKVKCFFFEEQTWETFQVLYKQELFQCLQDARNYWAQVDKTFKDEVEARKALPAKYLKELRGDIV